MYNLCDPRIKFNDGDLKKKIEFISRQTLRDIPDVSSG